MRYYMLMSKMTFEETQQELLTLLKKIESGITPENTRSFVPTALKSLAIHYFLYGGDPDDVYFVKVTLSKLEEKGWI